MIIVPVLRTFAQVLLGYALTFAASHGLNIPLSAQAWFIQVVMVGGGVAAYTALVRWCETSKYRVLRGLGHVLMLGTSVFQPTGYDTSSAIAQAGQEAGDHSLTAHPAGLPSTYRPDVP